MEPRQRRQLIRGTLDKTWLEFYQRIPHEPRSVRLGEYLEVSGKQNFKLETKRTSMRLFESAKRDLRRGEMEKERDKEDAIKEKEKETEDFLAILEAERIRTKEQTRPRRGAAVVQHVNEHADAISACTWFITMGPLEKGEDGNTRIANIRASIASARAAGKEPDIPLKAERSQVAHHTSSTSNRKNRPYRQAYDGACPFWYDPQMPEPPERLPRKRDRIIYERTRQHVVCFTMGDKYLIPGHQQVPVYHRPGFLEPYSHWKYVPKPFGTPLYAGTKSGKLPKRHPTKCQILPLHASDLRTYGVPVKPVRRYRFCNPTSTIVYKAAEQTLGFLPTYPDEIRSNVSWVYEAFDKAFHNKMDWNDEDRDADFDIILIETWKRLREWAERHPRRGVHLTDAHVEATGILPQRLEMIEDREFTRDLFDFPRDPSVIEAEAEVGSAETGDTPYAVPRVSSGLIVLPKNRVDKGPPAPGFKPVDLTMLNRKIAEGDVIELDIPSLEELVERDFTMQSGPSGSSSRRKTVAESGMSTRSGMASQSAFSSTEVPSMPPVTTRSSARLSQHQSREDPPSSRRRRRRPRVPKEKITRPRRQLTQEYLQELRSIFISARYKLAEDVDDSENAMFSNMKNVQELMCPNGSCRAFACHLHVDDAIGFPIPFRPIPSFPKDAKRLIEVDAVVRDPDFVPCHPEGECWFVKHNASDPGGAEADMPAHDLILLNTLLHGILDEKHGSFADWKVCKLVEAFELSNGPRGNGWSCVQLGRQIARLVGWQAHVQQPQGQEPARIIHAKRIYFDNIGHGQTVPQRSLLISKQIRELIAPTSEHAASTAAAERENERARHGRAPKFIIDHVNARPTDAPVCSHDGPCSSDVCDCHKSGNYCFRECPCPPTCRRRHQGCSCRTVDPGKDQRRPVCGTGDCPCFAANRECDPDLCGRCGAREAVENAVRPTSVTAAQQLHGHTWTPGQCRNVGLTSGEFQPVRVGYSQVHGYGLFAKADIPRHALVIEYVGDLIENAEADLRECKLRPIGLNYNFGLNANFAVDSSARGNSSRFINHDKKHYNIMPKVVVVHGNHHIEFRAHKAIKAGEELFFNYGKQFEGIATEEKQQHNDKRKRTSPPEPEVPLSASIAEEPPTSSAHASIRPSYHSDGYESEFFGVESSDDSDEYSIPVSKKRRIRGY